MKAEIISIGTELLLGNIVNTNAQYISKHLAALGIDVYFQTTVGDNPQRIRSVLDIAYSRADLCVITGGLGPTKDDITKEMIIAYFNRQPVLDDRAVEMMASVLKRAEKESLIESLKKQAIVPDNSIVLYNHHGLAPGSIIEEGEKICILLPGVPKEMEPMFEEYCIPYLRQISPQVIVSYVIRLLDFDHAPVSAVGEAPVADALGSLVDSENPSVATYVSDGGNIIRITAKAQSREKAAAMIEPVIRQCRCAIKDEYIRSVEEEKQ